MSGYFSDSTHRFCCIIRILPVIAVLAACSSSNSKPAEPTADTPPKKSFFSIVGDTFTGSAVGVYKAAQSPLEDLNLKRAPIPDKLQAITANPYDLPMPPDCKTVTGEIDSLDAMLGPDVSNTVNVASVNADSSSLVNSWHSVKNVSWENRDQYAERGSSVIQSQASGMVHDRLNSLIPYRSWIRWISGADAHAKKVAKAYEAGGLRRAYLKGFATSMHCWKPNIEVKNTPAAIKLDKKIAADKKDVNDKDKEVVASK